MQTSSDPKAAYFSTVDRAWELAAGALLAVGLPQLRKIPSKVRAVLSWTGIAGIIVATLLYTSTTAMPGWRALLPVLASGAVLVGGVGRPIGGAHLLLSRQPFRFIGDISYSLYLWHFPILILGRAQFGRHDTLWVRVALIAFTFLLSSLSYYKLENPLRHAKILLQRAWHGLLLWPVAVGLVLVTVFVATPSVPFAAATGPVTVIPVANAVANAVADGLANTPIPSATTPSLLAAPTDDENIGECRWYHRLANRVCEFGDRTGKKTVMVFGNSHATMWVPAIAAAAKASHWKFYPIVKEACGYDIYTAVAPGVSLTNQCPEWFAWAKTVIARLHPNVIVIGSYTKTADWIAGEKATIDQLKPLTQRLVLLSDTPWIPSPAGCLLKPGNAQGNCLWHESTARINAQTNTAAVASEEGVDYIDVTPWFCDEGLCPSIIDDIIPYKDGSHVTPEYATFLGNAMTRALNLRGGAVVQPGSVSLPTSPPTTTSTSSTTTSTTTSTTP